MVTFWIPRARPVRLIANTGAPHPSTATAAGRSPVSRSIVSRTATCSGWAASRYESMGQPFVTHARSIAACLPEQFM